MKRFITPIIIVIVAVIIFFGFTDGVINAPAQSAQDSQGNPMITGGIRALLAQRTALNDALENANKLKERIDQLTTDYNNISALDRAKLDKFLPDTVDNIQLILDVNNIASRNKMAIRSIKIATSADQTAVVGQTAKVNKYQAEAVALSFKVTASYEAFQKFIIDLSRSLRVTDVSATTFDSSDKTSYDYQVEIKTYWVR